MMKDFNFGVIIPLIGGFPLGAQSAIGKPPEVIFSFSAFAANDGLYLNYLKEQNLDVPVYLLDKDFDELLIEQYKGIDIIVGTPPCSGLSMSAQLSPEKRLASTVNDWMYKSAEFILDKIAPKIYVFENAPGMFTGVGCACRDNLKDIATKFGYSINFFKTDTMLHGIPQHRPRTYVIMCASKYAPILNFVKKDRLDITEYLKTIPESASMQDKYVCEDYDITNYDITQFLTIKYGEDWRKVLLDFKEHIGSYDYLLENDLMLEFKEYVESREEIDQKCLRDVIHIIKKISMGKRFRITHKVLLLDKYYVCAVIGELMERNVHPVENRRMNIREYMHLMGMPHDFQIYEKKDYAKLTQNTPVTTCEDIIRECVAVINEERNMSSQQFLMQNNIKQNVEIIKNKTTCLF